MKGCSRMMVFGYARVSSKEQNLERQIQAIKEFRPQIHNDDIFCDKESGRTFDRTQYMILKQILLRAVRSGEPVELVVEEFDRLGRNKAQVKEELAWLKEIGVIVRILNLPTTLVDYTEETGFLLEMVQNILIEVLGTIAQTELEFRAKRQREGIEIAKANGKYKGRKPRPIDEKQLEDVYNRWRSKELKAVEAMKLLDLKPNTFYRRIRQYEDNLYIDL